jgi:teichoic acid transport system permease protein
MNSSTKRPRIASEHRGFWRQIWQLALMDVQKSHRGSFFGWLWVIITPLIMLGFYWFVTAVGFHSGSVIGPNGSYAAVPWLVAGLVAWFFMSDMINAGVGAFRKYKFLVKKTTFPVATIPTIITISKLTIHGILLAICLLYLSLAGYSAWQWLQLPLYIVLATGMMWLWTLLAAPLGAISKDFGQFIKAMMRVLVWLSGIVWSVQNIQVGWVREIMNFNPVYFIAEGYRKSLLYHQWFFVDYKGLVIFIGEMIILATIAITIYRRTRRELEDIL